MKLYFLGILGEERKENKQQADESAKKIKLLQGKLVSSEATYSCLLISMIVKYINWIVPLSHPSKYVNKTNLKCWSWL